MNDLYALSQLIKALPFYSVHRDEIHHLYRLLAQNSELHAEGLLNKLKEHFPEVFLILQKNHELFKKHCTESQRMSEQGVRLICYGEENFPKLCYWMADPPLTLMYWGEPAWNKAECLSVVGSREPSFESVQWLEKEFAPFCDSVKPNIVSGGARGVDQKAHSTALRKNLSTVIVLPSGLGVLYPDSLREWIGPVLDQGGSFLSEYAFEQKMHKHLFHHRNRMIAALGKVTLLVEARRRSGTLITAQQALALGRPVWVVPGHPLDPHFSGSLDLLTEGAQLIRDAQDLTMYFNSEMNSIKASPAGLARAATEQHYL
ncbi:MAG: DNA-protecting protein DprA [Bdellovibrio sp.]|nr:DNA-protecting protein DprA [Bdellovibrio sp.]